MRTGLGGFYFHLIFAVGNVALYFAHPGEGVFDGIGWGNFVSIALSALQAFILALQMLGISYLLYALGRMLAAALWKRIYRVYRKLAWPSA